MKGDRPCCLFHFTYMQPSTFGCFACQMRIFVQKHPDPASHALFANLNVDWFHGRNILLKLHSHRFFSLRLYLLSRYFFGDCGFDRKPYLIKLKQLFRERWTLCNYTFANYIKLLVTILYRPPAPSSFYIDSSSGVFFPRFGYRTYWSSLLQFLKVLVLLLCLASLAVGVTLVFESISIHWGLIGFQQMQFFTDSPGVYL